MKFSIAAVGLSAMFVFPAVFSNEFTRISYYRDYVGYNTVPNLRGEISKEEAKSLKNGAYLIGYYDKNNRLIRVQDILRDQIKSTEDYRYFYNGDIKYTKQIVYRNEVKEMYYNFKINAFDSKIKLSEKLKKEFPIGTDKDLAIKDVSGIFPDNLFLTEKDGKKITVALFDFRPVWASFFKKTAVATFYFDEKNTISEVNINFVSGLGGA